MELPSEGLSALLAGQLREQLNQITASVQLLTPVVREQGERYDPYLAILNQSIYRLMRLVANLEFAQMPEEEHVLRPSTLDLAGLCRELGTQVAPLAKGMDVDFALEGAEGSLILAGDGALLMRMLLNLIANALRAAGTGGRMGLRLVGQKERAILTVWDSGAGLTEAQEAVGELPPWPTGLHLGLPVARRIAALHGGTLVLEQREERGLRAVVSLPVTQLETGGVLKTPVMGYDGAGGFSPVLVELSGVLPYGIFLPEDLE